MHLSGFKKDGNVVVLEFSKPQAFPVKQLYNFYFRYILPLFGKLISHDNEAVHVLARSCERFFPMGLHF